MILVTTSKALVTRSDALVSTSFLLLLVRHLLLLAWHLLLLAAPLVDLKCVDVTASTLGITIKTNEAMANLLARGGSLRHNKTQQSNHGELQHCSRLLCHLKSCRLYCQTTATCSGHLFADINAFLTGPGPKGQTLRVTQGFSAWIQQDDPPNKHPWLATLFFVLF